MRFKGFEFARWTLMLALLLSLGAPAWAQDAPAEEADEQEQVAPARPGRISADQIKRIGEAVEQLTEEAEHLDDYESENEVKAHFKRPHPAIRFIQPESGLEVLRRMMRPFTGNSFRDTYVRWHLMYVVKQAPQEDRKEMGQMFVRLIKSLPGPLKVELRQTHEDIPKDIARKYHQLMGQVSIVEIEGYPPFQRRRHWSGQAAIDRATGAQKERFKELYEQAKKLRPQWERVTDKAAIAFNRRVRQVDHISRQFRGELIYEMVKTGDPKILDLVVSTIVGQVQQEDATAFDLLAYMYAAAFDGYLLLYPEETLQKASLVFERAARANQQYREYKVGWGHRPGHIITRTRNFGDYAFHMIHMLRDYDQLVLTAPSRSDPN